MAYLEKVTSAKPDYSNLNYSLVCLGIFEDKELTTTQQKFDEVANRTLSAVLENEDFRGESGQVEVLHFTQKNLPKRLLLVGLGKKDNFNLNEMRKAAGTAVRNAQSRKINTFAVELFGSEVSEHSLSEQVQAVTEGLMLGSYQFTEYKTREKDKIFLSREAIILSENDVETKDIERASAIARASMFARDLASYPSNELTPGRMADEAKKIAKRGGFKCTVYDREQFEKMGMGGLGGVAKGTDEPPKFILMEYNGGKKGDAPVAFVGKGITFDSGGISIKPSKSMDEMKFDMCGAGAVLGIFHAIAEIKPEINAIGIAVSTENMPGGHAYKPGDILTAYNGKTIEVLNTDAEGRLALADGLSYASKEYNPKYMVNFATLTGAAVVALGHRATAIMGNNDDLVKDIINAGEYTGERCWQLPLWDDYSQDMKSEIADVKNIGFQGAGTITAGAFLKEFVGETKWAHLDIAGTAWWSEDQPYVPKGPSGVGVRLIMRWLDQLSS